MSIFKIFKKIPIDFGQKELRYKTKSSLIALELAGEGGGLIALDAGCSNGFWSEKLKQQNWKVISIDKESDYSFVTKYDLNNKLPFQDQTFDLFFSTAVIAYLDDPKKFLQEAKRVLKPNGKFIITTPNLNFWLNYVLKLFGTSLVKIADQNQKSFFVLNDIKKLFPKSSTLGYFPYIIVKFKIKRLIGILSPVFIIYGTKTNL